mgnify:CR=1 FL=1
MKLIAAALMFVALSANAETSLSDAVNAIRNQNVCIPATTYYGAIGALLLQTMEITALRQRIAELERQLVERK